MGKVLIINNANFKENALEHIELIESTSLWDNVNEEVKRYASSLNVTKELKNVIKSGNENLVTIVNGWKESIHSLVDTGKTPWIKNNGEAYFDTGYIPNNTSGAKIKFMSLDTTTDAIYYGSRAASGNFRYWLNLSKGKIVEFSVGASEGGNRTVDFGEPHTIEMNFCNDNKRKFDGEEYGAITPNLSLYKHVGIFVGYEQDDSLIGIPKGSISRVQISEGNTIIHDYIPYYKESKYCMVDIVSGLVKSDASGKDKFTYELL